jgi:hypothetical protein
MVKTRKVVPRVLTVAALREALAGCPGHYEVLLVGHYEMDGHEDLTSVEVTTMGYADKYGRDDDRQILTLRSLRRGDVKKWT